MSELVNRLGNLPLILAGPILRRVTDKSVTVWVAVRDSAEVTLEIYSGDPDARVKIVTSPPRPTIAIGRSLHILAITVQVNLTPGVVYTYDMFFDIPVHVSQLQLSGSVPRQMSAVRPTDVPNPLSYPPFNLPSFSLPPAKANDLRIMHGSCRMPHGDGPDALSILDELIRLTVQNATMRPHQLLLTGDQIYADDVAASLLMQLMDASNTLLGIDPNQPGWKSEERLVAPSGQIVPSSYPPLTRTLLMKRAGFTSADLRSHLMSLGEYLCMYLFTWSDVLWPSGFFLPTKDEIEAAAKDKADDITKRFILPADLSKVNGDINDLRTFLKTLPKVRRALANIPTYMICDDHDVTDDWNMTPGFCNAVYGNELGRRVVQNALVAYALCQLWGNTPEQFEADASNQPAAGRKLLTALDGKSASDYFANSTNLQTIVGVHSADQLKARKPESVFHNQTDWLTIGGTRVSADSLTYNFIYQGPAHQIVFTDTRSWRAYPHGNDATADLIPPDQFSVQIPTSPPLEDRVLMVVVTTNAPPVQPIRGATRHDTLSTVGSKLSSGDAHPDLFEAWEIPSLSFDRLLKTLTDKFKVDLTGTRYGQVILLSGDVHFSFASRLSYKATNRYGDVQAQKAQMVVAQLVASSFKKQNDDTVGFQRGGYFYVPHHLDWILGTFAGISVENKDMTEGYVGWNVPRGIPPFTVGSAEYTSESKAQVGVDIVVDTTDFKVSIRPISNDAPTIQIFPLYSWGGLTQNSIDLVIPPHYRYRLDYLVPSSQARDPSVLPNVTLPPLPAAGGTNPEDRKKAIEVFKEATGYYREHNKKAGAEKLIGRNNIGEITFDWGKRDDTGDHKKVNHTLRWRYSALVPENSTPDPEFPNTYVNWTTYTVSLDPNYIDPNDKNKYPDLKATVEP